MTRTNPNISRRQYVYGFSLIELMIALVLGLIMIGAIITVFVSNQASYRTKTALDNAQEAFRFGSHTLNRIARTSDGVDAVSTTDSLVLQLTGIGTLIRDCSGTEVPDGTTITNTFSVSDNRLQCTTTNPDSPNGLITLVGGVQSVDFRFGAAAAGAYVDNYVDNVAIATGPGWGNVRAVRSTITMDPGAGTISVEFTSALRANLVPEIIVVRPDE